MSVLCILSTLYNKIKGPTSISIVNLLREQGNTVLLFFVENSFFLVKIGDVAFVLAFTVPGMNN